MTPDHPFYSPNHKTPQVKPRPSEGLWTIRQEGVVWSAELRDHGECGIECQIFREGQLVIGRRFDLEAQAILWGEEERKEITRALAEPIG